MRNYLVNNIILFSRMQRARESKHDYLRDSIVLRGYDQKAFAEFAQAKRAEREESKDVDNWTLDQLKALVDDFKKTNQPSEDITDVNMDREAFSMFHREDLNQKDFELDLDDESQINFQEMEEQLEKNGTNFGKNAEVFNDLAYSSPEKISEDDVPGDVLITDLLERLDEYKNGNKMDSQEDVDSHEDMDLQANESTESNKMKKKKLFNNYVRLWSLNRNRYYLS